MRCTLVLLALLCALGFLHPLAATAITIATVPVGNAGNANDPFTGSVYGGVAYSYNIGKYDVTVGQYTAFLNAVAATDTYSLYNSSMATDQNSAGISQSGPSGNYTYSAIGSVNHPITYVSWGDAARFSNWLYNGQPTIGGEGNGTTETGSYTLNGATTNTPLNAVTRNTNATWVIPTENEWYKAAYNIPNTSSYYQYPFSSNTVPTSAMSGNTPNTGNFLSNSGAYAVTGSTSYSTTQNYLTDVGAYTTSVSPYGTFDMGGDIFQWNESLFNSSERDLRGGSWDNNSNTPSSSGRFGYNSSQELSYLGFRVAVRLLPGDYNQDSHVNAADINALELALTNLPLYKSTYGVSDAELLQINQLPGESTTNLNNSDLQALLNYLKAGGGSTDTVPEPSTAVLAVVASGLIWTLRKRRK